MKAVAVPIFRMVVVGELNILDCCCLTKVQLEVYLVEISCVLTNYLCLKFSLNSHKSQFYEEVTVSPSNLTR
jgi:hypothetical protein